MEPDYLSLFTSIRRACDGVRSSGERELQIEAQAKAAAEEAIADRQSALRAKRSSVGALTEAQLRLQREQVAMKADIDRIDHDTQTQMESQTTALHTSLPTPHPTHQGDDEKISRSLADHTVVRTTTSFPDPLHYTPHTPFYSSLLIAPLTTATAGACARCLCRPSACGVFTGVHRRGRGRPAHRSSAVGG